LLFIKNYNLKRHNIQAKKFLNKEQSLNSKKEKLAKQLEKYKKIFSLINRGKSANIECLNFMKDIASVIPYGVKLDFMKYSKGNIQLQGSTLSQGAFSQFCSKLDRALKDMKLKIESSSLKQSSDKKKIFELKITTRS
jgi:Tfp pilus assembly protein PilN